VSWGRFSSKNVELNLLEFVFLSRMVGGLKRKVGKNWDNNDDVNFGSTLYVVLFVGSKLVPRSLLSRPIIRTASSDVNRLLRHLSQLVQDFFHQKENALRL